MMICMRLTANQQHDADVTNGKMLAVDFRYIEDRVDTSEEMLTAIGRYIVREAIAYTKASIDPDGPKEEPDSYSRTFTLEVKIP